MNVYNVTYNERCTHSNLSKFAFPQHSPFFLLVTLPQFTGNMPLMFRFLRFYAIIDWSIKVICRQASGHFYPFG